MSDFAAAERYLLRDVITSCAPGPRHDWHILYRRFKSRTFRPSAFVCSACLFYIHGTQNIRSYTIAPCEGATPEQIAPYSGAQIEIIRQRFNLRRRPD